MRILARRLDGSEIDHELVWLERFACFACSGNSLVCDRFAMAAMCLSRAYRFAVCDLWNDAMRDSILSWSLSRCIEMESTRLHSAMGRNGI